MNRARCPKHVDNNDYKLLDYTLQMVNDQFCQNYFQNIVTHVYIPDTK